MGEKSEVGNSAIAKGCVIEGEVKNSVLSVNVTVKEGAQVSYSVLMPGAVVEEGAVVQYAILGENAVVAKGAKVGAAPETAEDPAAWGIAVLGPNTKLAENEIVPAKTMLDKTHQGV